MYRRQNVADRVNKTALAEMKKSLGAPISGAPRFMLEKAGGSLTLGTGLNWYNLAVPAHLFVPFLTPFRDKLPRVAPKYPGDAARWKSITALKGSGFDSMGFVPEGQRSGRMTMTASDVFATYQTIGEEANETFEARRAVVPVEDPDAFLNFLLLEKLMLKEEHALAGGNKSIKLGTVGTVSTTTATAAGATINETCSVICVALTYQGFQNSSAAAGVATQITVTGADGQPYTVNGGSSMKSAAASQVVATGNNLHASVTPIRGALAYAWYVGVAGSETLQSITPNSFVTYTTLTTTGQNASAVTQDSSYNDGTQAGSNPVTNFDGLLTTALNSANQSYFLDNAGASLTTDGDGNVVEIDTALQWFWDNYRVSPTAIFVSSQQAKDIRKKILNAGSAPLLRMNISGDGANYELVGGGEVAAYFNPFSFAGGVKIPIMLHPYLPAGSIFFHCEDLPAWYKSNETPQVAQVITRQDYYRQDWPLRTRAYEFGAYVDEVLAVYATFGLGIITNIGAG